jgi:nucleotide-binding universal stress UspA family protein
MNTAAKPAEKVAERKRIVCGTDFSKNAREAGKAAAALAERFGATLILAHVAEKPFLEPFAVGVDKALHSTKSQPLFEEAETLRKLNVTVKEDLLLGVPDEALVELARYGTCLIVVSSLGRRSPERWFLGSVSERTAERAKVPTLVVRNAEVFTLWARGERPLRIFVAFNFTVASEGALRWIAELLEVGPCDVVVGHVNWPPDERARFGGSGPWPLTQNPPEIQRLLERDIQVKAREFLGCEPSKIRVEPNWGRPDSRLVAMASEENADLIVIGSHQHHGFERLWNLSASRAVLHHAPMNVVVVPASTALAASKPEIPRFHRVLAATDFSALGDRAVPYAYATLTRGAVVKLIHVLQPFNQYVRGSSDDQARRLAERQHNQHVADSIEKLRGLIPPEAEALGIISEVEVLESAETANAICQEAARFDADLVCLGTHGRSGLAETVLGSVAQRIMAQSRRPLLVVRPPAP